MIQRAILVVSAFAALAFPRLATAQSEDRTSAEQSFTVEESEQSTSGTEASAEESSSEGQAEKDMALGEERVSWQDIVVVIRKPFLKMNRFELVPSYGLTINDNMIQHHAANAQANFYLTDVLAVGLEAQAFTKSFRETYDLVARQDRRLPTLNQYLWSASLNFHYVPIYGKFTIFNRRIIHWEWLFTVGVGMTQSEIIPRDPNPEKFPAWKNLLITPTAGLTTRVFLTPWLTLNLGVRDYVFIDKYEDANRQPFLPVETAKDQADSKLINHIMFQAGLSMWFPTSFRYTTFR